MIKNSKTKQKNAPLTRKDLITQQRLPKTSLLRIVKQPNGEFHLDWKQNMVGRGAYITPTIEAFTMVTKRNLLARAFKMAIKPEVYQQLLKEFEDGANHG